MEKEYLITETQLANLIEALNEGTSARDVITSQERCSEALEVIADVMGNDFPQERLFASYDEYRRILFES